MASQVYGEKAADGKGENAWLASSVNELLRTYPSFHVAYLDKVGDHQHAKQHGVTFSVLLRWDAAADKPVEVYRVRLPWQTEDKRGVVRCRLLAVGCLI